MLIAMAISRKKESLKNRCFKDFFIIVFHSQKTQYEKGQGDIAFMILKLTVFKGQSLGLTH